MSTSICIDRFVHLLTRHQSRLRTYILALLPNESESDDLLQETNTVLWRKREECASEEAFAAWACKIAYYEVLGYLRDRARDRHRFDDELLGGIAQAVQDKLDGLDDRREALRRCMQKLSPSHRRLLDERYVDAKSVKAMAASLNKSTNAVSRALYQLRKALMTCIQHRLAREGA